MSSLLSWIITSWTALLIASWLLYVLTSARLPSKRRPLVRKLDRFGREMERDVSPDYHVNVGEEHDRLS